MAQKSIACQLCENKISVENIWVCYSCNSDKSLCSNCTLRHHRYHEIYEWNSEEPELYIDDDDDEDIIDRLSVSPCPSRKLGESWPQAPPKVILVGGEPLGDAVQHYNPENPKDNLVQDSHLPNSFAGHVLVRIADKILISGGYNGARTKEVQKCDHDLTNWSNGPKMHTSRAFGVGLAVDDDFYMFGGTERGNSGERLSYLSDTWIPLPDSGIKCPIWGASIACLDNKIYILGGKERRTKFGSGIHNEVSIFDIRRGDWAENDEMHCARVGACAANYDETIIISGGRSHEGKDLINCELLDNRQRWITIAPMHYGRYKHQLIKCGTRLLAIGGEGLSSVEEYDCRMNRWTVLEPVLLPCWATAAFVTLG